MQRSLTPFQKLLIRKSQRGSKRVLKIKDWKYFKGDQVYVREGRDKGKVGMIKDLDEWKSVVWVEGVKMQQRVRNGKFVMAEQGIHYSNIQLIDPESGRPSRVKWRFTEKGEKVRIAVKSGALIPVPDQSQFEPPKPKANPAKDTDPGSAAKETYIPILPEIVHAEESSGTS